MSRGGEILLNETIPLSTERAREVLERWKELSGQDCPADCKHTECDVVPHFALLLECFSQVTSVETLRLHITREHEEISWEAKAAHVAMTVVLAVLSHTSCPAFNRVAWIWSYVPFPSDPDKLRYTLFAYITLIRALRDENCSPELLRESMRDLVLYFNNHVRKLLELARRSYREDALDNALILISAVSKVLDSTYDRQVVDLRREILENAALGDLNDR